MAGRLDYKVLGVLYVISGVRRMAKTRVCVRLSPNQLLTIQELAMMTGQTESEVIRMLINIGIIKLIVERNPGVSHD